MVCVDMAEKQMTSEFNKALQTISSFLEAPERKKNCLNIHQLQGMITAFNSCPDYVSEADFIFEVMGECDDGLDQWFEEGELRTAWITCLNEIDEALALDTFSLDELYSVDNTTQAPSPEFRSWCDGYMRGVLLTEFRWKEIFETLNSEELSGLKQEHESMLSLLACFEDWGQALKDNKDPERLKQGFLAMIKTLEGGVKFFHKLGLHMEEYQLQNESDHTPYIREEIKVGRNDPCPCGSGKKYKKCCLH